MYIEYIANDSDHMTGYCCVLIWWITAGKWVHWKDAGTVSWRTWWVVCMCVSLQPRPSPSVFKTMCVSMCVYVCLLKYFQKVLQMSLALI